MARSQLRRFVDLVVDTGVSLFHQYRSSRRLFLDYERTLIRDATTGARIKIVGRLRGRGRELKAPLSGVGCLWYRTAVKVAAGETGQGKKVVEEEPAELLVDDDSGCAVIRVRGARVSLVDMRSGYAYDRPTFPEGAGQFGAAARRFLDGYAVDYQEEQGFMAILSTALSRAPREVSYKEVVLREGDSVAVVGRPRIEIDPFGAGGFRTPPIRVVFDEADDVVISNEPGVF